MLSIAVHIGAVCQRSGVSPRLICFIVIIIIHNIAIIVFIIIVVIAIIVPIGGHTQASVLVATLLS
eukprot:gnl/Chilomastix_caulleri/4270.p1 GENE.gnl/Chilomastix_caulleri/4270~~gnl/Chilomastix_caulleri/4270.p1  ORF type:complete len:66 (-),score=6.60 gnl/Chilomastix_caulleri/4270:140-337(-)